MIFCGRCGSVMSVYGTCGRCIDELSPEVGSIIIKDSTIRILKDEGMTI